MKTPIRFVTSSIAVVALLAMTQASYGQLVAYKARGVGSEYDTTTGIYGGPGNATHLGSADFSGSAFPDFPEVPLPGVAYPVTFGDNLVASNKKGDKIFFSGEGTVTLIDLGDGTLSAVWNAEFTVEGGEGKFANVSGGPEPLTVTAVNEPFTLGQQTLIYSWRLSGQVDLGKNKNK